MNPDNPGERSFNSGGVAHHIDDVTGHNRLRAKLAGSGAGEKALLLGVLLQNHPVAATVHRDDETILRILVLGAIFRAGFASTLAGSNSGLIPFVALEIVLNHGAADSTRLAQSSGNSGSVLPVLEMSSTTTPLTPSPRRAPEVAMR